MTAQIPTSVRFLLARVNDRALDVHLLGRHHAYTYLNAGNAGVFILCTMPFGKRHNDPEATERRCDLCAITDPGWGGMTQVEAIEYCQRRLTDMLKHLDALAAEGEAQQEVPA